ncbi:MAG: helix-turn-helix transcriptional regulator [Planctomycetes bacterium]|nr:helix-turn-helix transcriptional regulator [Planctomycetota bacterium]
MEGLSSDRAAFTSRLRNTIKSYGNANALAKASGFSEGTLRKWVRGESEPTRERLITIASVAGVRLEWLATGRGPEQRQPEDGLPLLEGYCTLEWLERNDTNPDAPVAFRGDWIEATLKSNRDELALLRIPDDSMEPIVSLSSVVVVDTSEAGAPRDGIYALRVGDNLIARRLQTLPSGEIEVSADNPVFKSFRFLRGDQGVKVLGRIVWVGRHL